MSASIPQMDDGELVACALRGEQSAIGEIYDRYADSIYSFCRSRLRNDADAADATQDTFIRAATRLSQLREPAKLRSWLYAIARNQVIATGRTAARLSGDDQMELIVAADAEPDIDLLRVEMADQLWDAAGGLAERDQEVLELHLRHGLVGQDLSDALGVSESHANVLLSRMRDRVGTCLGSLLVAREGRDNCYDLDLLLAAWDGRFSLDIRSKVTRHVRACDTCEQTHTRVLASGISFGILPIMPAPSTLRLDTLAKMSEALGLPPTAPAPADMSGGPLQFADPSPSLRPPTEGDGWEWQPNGFPGAVVKKTSRGAVLLSAAAAFIVLVVLGGVTAAVFNDGGSVETAAPVEVAGAIELASTTTSSSTSVPPSLAGAPATTTEASTENSTTTGQTPTTEIAPTEIPASEVSASTVGTVATSTVAPATLASTTTQPTETPTTTTVTPTTTTSTTTTVTPTTTASTTTTSTTTTEVPTTTTEVQKNESPVFVRATVRPARLEIDQGRCQGDPALVIAQVTDSDGEIASVFVEWESGNGQTTRTRLTNAAGASPDVYSGEIGPWFVEGRQSSTVVAADDDGANAQTRVSVTVTGCPATLRG